MRSDAFLGLIAVLVPLSLAAVGGGASVFAPLQHQSVDIRHWLTAHEFIDMFAVARAAPGPATMIATLIGWQVGGLAGAVVATMAMFVPSSLLCYGVSKVWNVYRGRPWHTALEQGLAPIAAGLIFAGGMAIFQISGSGVKGAIVALGVLSFLVWRPKTHPFVPLIAGALVFIGVVFAGG